MPREWIRCTSTRFQIAFEIQIEYFSLFCGFHMFIYIQIYIYIWILCGSFHPLKYATPYGYCLALDSNSKLAHRNFEKAHSGGTENTGKVLGKNIIKTTKVFHRNTVKFLKCGFSNIL